MKKYTLLLPTAFVLSLSLSAQPSKWFVSVASGVPVGGPVASIKNNMQRSGFDHTSFYNFFWIFSGTTTYPAGTKNLPLLVKMGKRLTDKRSLYIMGGVSSSGAAEGFKKLGYNNSMDPIYSSTFGIFVDVRYKILQLAAGYQYSSAKSRAKVAIAPSLFLFKYKNASALQEQRYTAFVPGAAFTARLPLGKEKKLFGIDLVAELNLVPPVKMKPLTTTYLFDDKSVSATLNGSTVNLVHGMLGLAYSFRR